MKNLFYVHSHITYYVSKGIIEDKNYTKESIIFVTSRNYYNDDIKLYNVVDVSKIHDELDSFNVLNFYKKHKYILETDVLIESKINIKKGFRAYLPHVFHPVMQIIASNKNCKELHIIEEGVNAYSSYFMHFKEKSPIKAVVKNLLNNISFIGKNRIFYTKTFDLRKFSKSKPSVFYTITSKGFKGLPYTVKRVSIKPINSIDFAMFSNSIIVLEGAVEQGNMKKSTMHNGIKNILKDIENKDVYIKFHPAQTKSNIKEINELIQSQNKTPIEIPNNIPFEELLLTHKNLNVYGFTTSLLFYAKELGSNAYSYEDKLEKDELFKSFRAKNDFDLKQLLDD